LYGLSAIFFKKKLEFASVGVCRVSHALLQFGNGNNRLCFEHCFGVWFFLYGLCQLEMATAACGLASSIVFFWFCRLSLAVGNGNNGLCLGVLVFVLLGVYVTQYMLGEG
jgi:hypothetical protein